MCPHAKYHPLLVDSLVYELLKDRHFNQCVDLGCGTGAFGRISRPYCTRLIGVDLNPQNLKYTRKLHLYDLLVQENLLDYPIPYDTDLIALLEVIEHMPHKQGEFLLERLDWVPNILLSTPAVFVGPMFGHVSLWTEEQLQAYGFMTRRFSGWIAGLFAWKGWQFQSV